MKNLKDYVIDIPNFPKEGIIFHDITGILQDKEGLQLAINGLIEQLRDVDFDVIVAPESRGFVFGVPVAYALKKSFIPARKKGKLPRETVSASYDLEYGQEVIEIHKDAIKNGDKVVIIDDLIATGGTVKSVASLIESLGAKVSAMIFVIELGELKGREILNNYDVKSLIYYEGK